MKSKVQFLKIRKVKSPNRAHSTDAGTDLFIPELDDKFLEDLKEKNVNNKLEYQYIIDGSGCQELEIIIPPQEQVNIPSGLKVNITDKNTYLQASNKSGVASKYHLDVMANIIDADYRGEIHLNLVNTGNVDIEIFSGMKVLQVIQKEYIDTQWEEITEDQFNKLEKTDRGDGGFGSSGIK